MSYVQLLTCPPQKSNWEAYATQLANATTDQALLEIYHGLEKTLKIKDNSPSRVIFARDTRASGLTLVNALKDALGSTGTEYTDFGLLTTPQLHYLVRCVNTKGTAEEYGEISETGYYEKLSQAFKVLMKGQKVNGSVVVDCANGVGGPKLRELIKYLPKPEDGSLEIKVVNDDVVKPESLNYQVWQLPSLL